LVLDKPTVDWVALAVGLGVHGVRADTNDQFEAALLSAFGRASPSLIEAVL
jgi:thiamine pyrophosphate-dependent acetolactate synthase large subunit-like protein